MANVSNEIFFSPEPVSHQETTISAALYNRCRLMLSRCNYDHVFVPIRSMQYLAVIDADEVIFVDSQAYVMQAGEGGRMVMITWRLAHASDRTSLDEPVAVEARYHHEKAMGLHNRLLVEFDKALVELELRRQGMGCEPKNKKVIPFRH